MALLLSIFIDRRFPCWYEDISTGLIFCSKAHQSSPFSERPAFFQPRLSSMRLLRSEGWFHARVNPFMDAPCGAFHSVAQVIPSFCFATFYSHSRIYSLTCVLVGCTAGGEKKRPPRGEGIQPSSWKPADSEWGKHTKTLCINKTKPLEKKWAPSLYFKKKSCSTKRQASRCTSKILNIERRWNCDSVKFRRI